MPFKRFQRRNIESIVAGLCLLAFAALLLALVLSQARNQRQQLAADFYQINLRAQHLLDRPAPLDTGYGRELGLLGEKSAALGRDLGGWSLGDVTLQKNNTEEAYRGIQALLAQVKGFERLAKLLQDLDGLDAQPGQLLQGLRSDDATVSSTKRVRGFLADCLARAVNPRPYERVQLSMPDMVKRLQEAVALLDQFQSRRSQVLSLLSDAEQRAASAALTPDDLPIELLTLLAVLTAVIAAWRATRLVAPEPAPEPLPAPRAGQSELDFKLSAVPAEPVAEAWQPVALDPALAEAAAEAAAAAAEKWEDLRLAINEACDASWTLEMRARSLVDDTLDTPHQAQDEVVADLLALSELLQRSREGTVNIALDLLAEGADEDRVEAFEGLDLHLVQSIDALARLETLRRSSGDMAEMTTVVSRRDLVRLQSEVQHLAQQLGMLRNNLDVEASDPGEFGTGNSVALQG